MANDDIKYTLNVQTVDNPLTEDPKDTRFVLVSNGTADFDRVVSEIMALNPGLERETVEAVIRFEHRVIKRLTLNGMRVSNGLFSAVASPKGRGGSAWDPSVNTLDIAIAQGADWREAIRNTNINVLGPKAEVMYIAGTQDAATRGTAGEATAGRPFSVTGNYLKVAGTDPKVGIFLVDSKGEETRVTEDYWAVNEPKKLTFIIPAGLADGTYTLRVTTQFSRGGNNGLLKEPRSVEWPIYVGVAPEVPSGGGGEEEGGGGSMG